MADKSLDPLNEVTKILRARLGAQIDKFLIPPPVFKAMQGEFLHFDQQNKSLSAQFPILDHYLNPYHAMQGGFVAAAVDNVLGPLSMLVAPPNVTRRLEIKYSLPISLETAYIVVTAELTEQKGPWLFLKATVRDPSGVLLARAKAVHWILPEEALDEV